MKDEYDSLFHKLWRVSTHGEIFEMDVDGRWLHFP